MFYRTGMGNDPLSDILHLAEVESVVSGGFHAGGAWSVRFPAPDKLKFFAVAHGSCWLQIDGHAATKLEDGDVVLLAAGLESGFVLASDLAVPAQDRHQFFAGRSGEIVPINPSRDNMLIGGHIRLHPAHAQLLTANLPAWLHIRSGAREASNLRWILDRMVEECATPQPATHLARTQLAHLLFVHVLRAHLSEGGAVHAGGLRAAVDARLGPAMHRIHADPAHPWRLDTLAEAASMSRTAFAARFKELCGMTPLNYVTEWRMHLARRALHSRRVPVITLARELGYGSESAFSHAFKRVVGVAPAHYVHEAHPPAP